MKMRAFLLCVHMNNQQWQKTFEIGGGGQRFVCVRKQAGAEGMVPQEKFAN